MEKVDPAMRPRSRTYRAATLREALARVRADLGGDAVILHSRELQRRRWLRGGVRELVEVTAIPGERGTTPHTPLVAGAPRVATSLRADGPALAPWTTRDEPAPPAAPDLGARLSELHALVERLSRQGRIDHLVPELPEELTGAYADLVEAEVPEPLARQLVRTVAEMLGPRELHRTESIRAALRATVESVLPVAPPVLVVPGTRRVVALVGPTGVGKTTTVAKLAANLKLVQQARVALVTVDTYRIAAVEQLRTYAEIIDLPLAVVNTPEEMTEAVTAFAEFDLVLIDTAGRSPRDEVKIRELAGFLEAAHPDEVHLVLSATAGEKSLRAAVERFAIAHADRLILTKLDEAEGLGTLLAVIAQADRPVSYLTTGQAVPDDIEPADRHRLARLILGDDAVG
jgi:flagellar biosynthesis protein FlhF